VFAVPTRPDSVYVPGVAAVVDVPAANSRYSTGARGAAPIAVRAVGKIACSVAVPVTSVSFAIGGVSSSPAMPPVSAVGSPPSRIAASICFHVRFSSTAAATRSSGARRRRIGRIVACRS
jgi:hypothetical protein